MTVDQATALDLALRLLRARRQQCIDAEAQMLKAIAALEQSRQGLETACDLVQLAVGQGE